MHVGRLLSCILFLLMLVRMFAVHANTGETIMQIAPRDVLQSTPSSISSTAPHVPSMLQFQILFHVSYTSTSQVSV